MEENKDKVVLTGTYESSYNKLRKLNKNRINKINLEVFKLIFNKFKK